MDVEKRVVITSGMDASGVSSGMATVTTEAAKMAAGVTQSVGQISRALLDSKAGFDALAKNFVDGWRNAQNFAQGVQTAYRTLGDGRDKLGMLPQLLDNISAKYGVFGEAARQAALKMGDATATQEQKLRAFMSLIDASNAKMAAVSQGALANIGTTQPGLQASLQQQRLASDPIEQRVAAQRMAEVQSTVNRFAGVGAGSDTADRAADIEAYGAALDKLREQYDPMFAAQQQYNRNVAGVSDALKRGAIDQEVATARTKDYAASLATTQAGIASHSKNLDNLTGTTWSQQFAMRQLGVQTIQTFSGFATGQPIMMTLIQQGHQVVDVALSAGIGLRAMAEGVWNFTKALLSNPITLFIIGIVALTAALVGLVVHAQNAVTRIGELQNQMRASRDDADKMAVNVEQAARRLASTSSLGFDESFKALADIAKHPAFQGTRDQLVAVGVQVHRLALTLGTDLPAASKIMMGALDNAAGAAQTLMDQHHFGAMQGVTQEWVNSLKQMTQAQALDTLLAKIAEVTAKSKEHFTNLGSAWQRFLQLISASEGSPGYWARLGGYIADGLAAGLRVINLLVEALYKLQDAMERLPNLRNLLGDPSGFSRGAGGGPQQYAGMFTGAETQYGLPPGLLSAIAKRESGYDPTAVNKASGAGGMMQILESTARDPGGGTTAISAADRFDPKTSIQFAGQYIANVAQKLGSLDAAIKQYSGGGYTLASLGVAGTGFGPTVQDTSKAAEAASANALAKRRADNEAQRRDLQAGIDAQSERASNAFSTGGDQSEEFNKASAKVTQYSQALKQLQKDQYDNIEPQQKLARDMEEANRPRAAAAGFFRLQAELEQRFRAEARETGVDQVALGRARSELVKTGISDIKDQVDALDIQTNAERAQFTLMKEGGQVAENAMAFENAQIAVRKVLGQGTIEYTQAVIDLTDAERRRIEVKHEGQAATDIALMKQEQELLVAEARLIGASTLEREKELAVIRERQKFGLAVGQVAPPNQQEALDLKSRNAEIKVANDEARVNYAELANATSQAFDTIGNAIAQAFVSGEGAAVSFQNVFKAVVAQIIQEAIKLSIINPILKALFPGSTGGLATAGGVLGGGGGAAAGVTGGAFNAAYSALGDSYLFAKGGVFSGSPSLSAFSNSIVASPTLFDTGLSGFRAYAQGGLGIMGEGGNPEAIIPLVRGPSGDLGIRGSGGGSSVSVQVNTPITINGGGGGQSKPMDPSALKALQQQIDITVRHAVRGVIVDERRPGGDLYR